MTKAERQRLDALARLGCLVCLRAGYHSQPEIHHIRRSGEPRKHERTIPLCPQHHRGQYGVHHMGRKAFEREHGAQEDMLAEVNNILEEGQ